MLMEEVFVAFFHATPGLVVRSLGHFELCWFIGGSSKSFTFRGDRCQMISPLAYVGSNRSVSLFEGVDIVSCSRASQIKSVVVVVVHLNGIGGCRCGFVQFVVKKFCLSHAFGRLFGCAGGLG